MTLRCLRKRSVLAFMAKAFMIAQVDIKCFLRWSLASSQNTPIKISYKNLRGYIAQGESHLPPYTLATCC